ncbi:transposase [Clostridium estertheticum]|uniref:transposase n=1 Tax=Clostridium estertheticum TaxID=238834 RepID=UPI001CCACE72|nr:transposase [Clostridium estertheticum]MBZ9614846.1 transposase [Clostridium estertheticum subsp. laramiense]WAG74757.1 transposase [Clostridium estertheticum]
MKATLRCLLYNPSNEDFDLISDMMNHFCKAKHFAYKRLEENRFTEGFKIHELSKIVSENYGLNSRQSKDAVEQARQTMISQVQLLNLRITECEGKVEKLLKKFDKGVKLEQRHGLISKLDKRLRKLCTYLTHKTNNTLPSVIFGGKENFYKRCKGTISKEDYQLHRNNQFVSRGDKTKKGNPNLRIVIKDTNVYLEITTLESTKTDSRLKSDGSFTKSKITYKKILTPIYIPQKLSKKTGKINGFNYKDKLLMQVVNENSYQVELLLRDGKIYAHVTFELEKTEVTNTCHNFIIGIDTNPDGLALTMIDNKGNYKWHYYLKNTELLTASSTRRVNLCGELAKSVVWASKTYGCGIAVEDLEFINDKDVHSKIARKTSQFCYRLILTMIESACYKNGVEFIKVKAQYTSKIGLYKYCHQYGMDVHNGAAMVIARRSYGFKEKVPKLYKGFFKPIPIIKDGKLTYTNTTYSNEWSNWYNVSARFKIDTSKGLLPRICY